MTPAERIIEKFGGINPMARKLKIPPSTVQGWKDRGFIPSKRQTEILNAAPEWNVDLSHADFFEEGEAA
jgi:ribosomal protein S16